VENIGSQFGPNHGVWMSVAEFAEADQEPTESGAGGINSRPCKKRKDGAPSVVALLANACEGWATRPISYILERGLVIRYWDL